MGGNISSGSLYEVETFGEKAPSFRPWRCLANVSRRLAAASVLAPGPNEITPPHLTKLHDHSMSKAGFVFKSAFDTHFQVQT